MLAFALVVVGAPVCIESDGCAHGHCQRPIVRGDSTEQTGRRRMLARVRAAVARIASPVWQGAIARASVTPLVALSPATPPPLRI